MIGICGDNCAHCPRYVATRRDSPSELEKVGELWVRLGLRDTGFPVEKMACVSCRPENNCAYAELRACVTEKAHANCGWCEDYPCELIRGAFEKSEMLRRHARKVCTPEELHTLDKAFFSKKEYFDRIHQERLKKVGKKNDSLP